MDEVWSWLNGIPSSDEWRDANSTLTLPVASSGNKSIQLKAERTAGSNTEALVTFSICLLGFHASNPSRTLWVSDPCPLSSPLLPLLLQLLQEVIACAPSKVHSSSLKLDPQAIDAAVAVTDEAPAFLSLVLLCRLFWLCACDAPADAGFLFFQVLERALERALGCKHAVRGFLASVGADWEERFMRSLGYMLAKWFILRELQAAQHRLSRSSFCLSYATDSHGLWVLKGFAPVFAMSRVGVASSPGSTSGFEAKESLLRYALAHQQLEAVLQLEYSVCMQDPRFIRIGVRVDNIRLHVVRLGFGNRGLGDGDDMAKNEGSSAAEERHFPSRIRVWVGPDMGSAYASVLSLGRSTGNPEKEIEMTRIVKGSFGNSKNPKMKPTARSSARLRARSWRWEQETEGSAGVFEGVLCDGATGVEVATWRPGPDGPTGVMRRRYNGHGRVFSKAGGLVVAGDELPEGVNWRVGRELEGKVVKWRLGGKIWVSYSPNELKSRYFETRCVEWREEVDLPLVAGK